MIMIPIIVMTGQACGAAAPKRGERAEARLRWRRAREETDLTRGTFDHCPVTVRLRILV